jgi:hypothetical protein
MQKKIELLTAFVEVVFLSAGNVCLIILHQGIILVFLAILILVVLAQQLLGGDKNGKNETNVL